MLDQWQLWTDKLNILIIRLLDDVYLLQVEVACWSIL